jgi:Na+/melibiose symporter-like transporter
MLQGFFLMSTLYFIIGTQWDRLRNDNTKFLLLLYGLTFFFANYGPNTSTFVLPSLIFENEESRTTLNGICAAFGKFGALLGATLFDPTAEQYGDGTVMIICSVISTIAFIITYWFVPNTATTTTTSATNAATTEGEIVLHNNEDEVVDYNDNANNNNQEDNDVDAVVVDTDGLQRDNRCVGTDHKNNDDDKYDDKHHIDVTHQSRSIV